MDTSTSNRHTTPGILTEAAKSKYQHPAVMLIGLDNGDYFIANIIIPILDIYLGVISVAKQIILDIIYFLNFIAVRECIDDRAVGGLDYFVIVGTACLFIKRSEVIKIYLLTDPYATITDREAINTAAGRGQDELKSFCMREVI